MGGRGSGSGKSSTTGYREPKTDSEISQLDQDLLSDDWKDSMTSAEEHAVYKYTGSWHSYANKMLRQDKFDQMDSDDKKIVRDISKGIAKYQLKENVVVYRGASLSAFNHQLTESNMNDWIGSKITDKGFMSTSIKPNVADGFGNNVIFKIKAPKGTNAAYVANNTQFNHEKELLFDRGTEMKITGITKHGNQYHVDAIVVKKKKK